MPVVFSSASIGLNSKRRRVCLNGSDSSDDNLNSVGEVNKLLFRDAISFCEIYLQLVTYPTVEHADLSHPVESPILHNNDHSTQCSCVSGMESLFGVFHLF